MNAFIYSNNKSKYKRDRNNYNIVYESYTYESYTIFNKCFLK